MLLSEEIEIFLSVVEHGSILRGAQNQFVSQSTASSRIQNLEGKLGVKLFHRQKGIKEITLTIEGKEFLSIAKQWLALWQNAQNLTELQTYTELRISAGDLVNSHLFTDIYKNVMRNYRNIVLNIQTHHSSQVYPLVDKQMTDIGIVSGLYNYPNVKYISLLEEELVIVYHKDSQYAKTKNKYDLQSEDEIYSTWSKSFSLWHDQYFPASKRKKIKLGTMAMLPLLFEERSNWSIVSQSVAEKLKINNPDIIFSKIVDSPPPKRILYFLFNQHSKPAIKEVAHIFFEEITNHFKSNNSVKLLINDLREIRKLF